MSTPRHKASTTPQAVDRAKRTLIQGAALTALVAIASAVSLVVAGWQPADVMDPASWANLGGTALVSVLLALAAYVHAKIAPPLQ